MTQEQDFRTLQNHLNLVDKHEDPNEKIKILKRAIEILYAEIAALKR